MTSAMLKNTDFFFFSTEFIGNWMRFLSEIVNPFPSVLPPIPQSPSMTWGSQTFSTSGRSSVIQEVHDQPKKRIGALQGIGFLTELCQWFTSFCAWVCKGRDIRLPYSQTQISASHQAMQVGRNCNWMVEMVSNKVFHCVSLAYPPAYFTKPVRSTTLEAQHPWWNWIKWAQWSKRPSTWKNKAGNKKFRITVPVNNISPVWELEISDADVHLPNATWFELAKWYHYELVKLEFQKG